MMKVSPTPSPTPIVIIIFHAKAKQTHRSSHYLKKLQMPDEILISSHEIDERAPE